MTVVLLYVCWQIAGVDGNVHNVSNSNYTHMQEPSAKPRDNLCQSSSSMRKKRKRTQLLDTWLHARRKHMASIALTSIALSGLLHGVAGRAIDLGGPSDRGPPVPEPLIRLRSSAS